jgi:ankyrin repeat protein
MFSIGADPNTRASDGLTPLWIAVINGDSETARLLVEGGCHSPAVYERGVTTGDIDVIGGIWRGIAQHHTLWLI